MSGNYDLEVEQRALRRHGMLGRFGPYGNELFAMQYDDLPDQAKIVLDIIANGGPFQYEQDGSLYANRSEDLPGLRTDGMRSRSWTTAQPYGAGREAVEYREFTVLTPGAAINHATKKPQRGRRRLVIKRNGMTFFTACHYDRVAGQAGSEKHAAAIADVDKEWRSGFYIVLGLPSGMRARLAATIERIRASRLPALSR